MKIALTKLNAKSNWKKYYNQIFSVGCNEDMALENLASKLKQSLLFPADLNPSSVNEGIGRKHAHQHIGAYHQGIFVGYSDASVLAEFGAQNMLLNSYKEKIYKLDGLKDNLQKGWAEYLTGAAISVLDYPIMRTEGWFMLDTLHEFWHIVQQSAVNLIHVVSEVIDIVKEELQHNHDSTVRCINRLLSHLSENDNADKTIHNHLVAILYRSSNNKSSEEDVISNKVSTVHFENLLLKTLFVRHEKGRKNKTYNYSIQHIGYS